MGRGASMAEEGGRKRPSACEASGRFCQCGRVRQGGAERERSGLPPNKVEFGARPSIFISEDGITQERKAPRLFPFRTFLHRRFSPLRASRPVQDARRREADHRFSFFAILPAADSAGPPSAGAGPPIKDVHHGKRPETKNERSEKSERAGQEQTVRPEIHAPR